MKIQIARKNYNVKMPIYASQGASGMDVHAYLDEIGSGIPDEDSDEIITGVIINPFQRILIPTGIKVAIPEGYEIQVRPRSGLALKKGITVVNTPGTVDSDYRGEIGVILINLSKESVIIKNQERIAQIVLCAVEKIEWNEVNGETFESQKTERNSGGFGSTGS